MNTASHSTAPASAPSTSSARTSRYPANLPISRKAYDKFVERIHRVFPTDPETAGHMITLMKMYLAKGEAALEPFSISARVAFAFLAQDIDVAIERSARARQRARERREAREAQIAAIAAMPRPEIPQAPEPEKYVTIHECNPNGTHTIIHRPLSAIRNSRRERRAQARKAKTVTTATATTAPGSAPSGYRPD